VLHQSFRRALGVVPGLSAERFGKDHLGGSKKMKTIFRSLSMAAVVAVFAVAGAFAQNVCDDIDTPTGKYEVFTAHYQKNKLEQLPDIKIGLAAGKEFLEKWGACEAWVEQAKFVKGHVPRLEKMVKDMEEYIDLKPITDRFDPAINTDNYDEIYAAGKLFIGKKPDNLSAKFVMAVSGVGEAAKALQAKGTAKYSSESLAYAKLLYDHIKGGGKLDRQTKDGKELIGYLKWERTREEALSQLAYTLGYVNYYGLNNKKAAVPYYYEAAQVPGYFKTYPAVFATIGEFYLDQAAPIGAEIIAIGDKIKNAPTEEEKVKLNAEAEAKEALFKGYTERAMDAFSRAHAVAKDATPAEKAYKDGLKKEIDRLYNIRFGKMDGQAQWISATLAKPLPNPTSTVEPIVDPKPETTTTTTGGTGTGIGAANGTGVGAANGTGVAPKAGPVAKKP
jgi:hypothetical protein